MIFSMKNNCNRSALILMLIGILLFVINVLDVFLGYYKTHGKGFQISGLSLIIIGIIIWKKIRWQRN